MLCLYLYIGTDSNSCVVGDTKPPSSSAFIPWHDDEMNSESCPNLSKSVKSNGSFESWLVYCALSLCCGRRNACELSRSSRKVVWPWNLVLVILSPSPPSVSLDIVVSVGSWFATPLGVDLVSAPCCAWPGGNRRRGGVDERRHRIGREGVGGWGYLELVVLSICL